MTFTEKINKLNIIISDRNLCCIKCAIKTFDIKDTYGNMPKVSEKNLDELLAKLDVD